MTIHPEHSTLPTASSSILGHKTSTPNWKADCSGVSMPTLQMKKLRPQLALGRDLSSRKGSGPRTRAHG